MNNDRPVRGQSRGVAPEAKMEAVHRCRRGTRDPGGRGGAVRRKRGIRGKRRNGDRGPINALRIAARGDF